MSLPDEGASLQLGQEVWVLLVASAGAEAGVDRDCELGAVLEGVGDAAVEAAVVGGDAGVVGHAGLADAAEAGAVARVALGLRRDREMVKVVVRTRYWVSSKKDPTELAHC